MNSLLRPLFGCRQKLDLVVLQHLEGVVVNLDRDKGRHERIRTAPISGSKGSSGLGLFSFSCTTARTVDSVTDGFHCT